MASALGTNAVVVTRVHCICENTQERLQSRSTAFLRQRWGTNTASRKHAHVILTPLNPILYSKAGVYRGIHYFSYFAKNIDCGYSLEPPRRGGSNEYPQSMFWARIWKKKSDCFLSEYFNFLVVKFSIYLNRRVFVMTKQLSYLKYHRHTKKEEL